MRRRVVGLALLAWAGAGAAAPRLDSVSVQVLSGKGSDVVISVSIERPTLLDLTCSATIDTGDGGRIPIAWNLGDSRTKTARYEYKRPGAYRVRVGITKPRPYEQPELPAELLRGWRTDDK